MTSRAPSETTTCVSILGCLASTSSVLTPRIGALAPVIPRMMRRFWRRSVIQSRKARSSSSVSGGWGASCTDSPRAKVPTVTKLPNDSANDPPGDGRPLETNVDRRGPNAPAGEDNPAQRDVVRFRQLERAPMGVAEMLCGLSRLGGGSHFLGISLLLALTLAACAPAPSRTTPTGGSAPQAAGDVARSGPQ